MAKCKRCNGNGRIEMLEHCPICGGDGIEPIKFLASYMFDGGSGMSEWSIEFFAKDKEEAKRRLLSIQMTLRLNGEIDGEINF